MDGRLAAGGRLGGGVGVAFWRFVGGGEVGFGDLRVVVMGEVAKFWR